MGSPDDGSGDAPELVAFTIPDRVPMELVPAQRWRAWMNETQDRFANRCLPLLMANELGWVILNPLAFEATWTGKASPASTTVRFDETAADRKPPVESYFGYGILTWSVSYLFRTPPGWNLLARGPATRLPSDA